jgi:hypothetical protein
VVFRRVSLEPKEIVLRRGFPATSPLRTVADLAWRLPLFDAVAAVDMALHRRLLTLDDLGSRAIDQHGKKGVRRLRRVLDLAHPAAESAMETRLRLVLHFGGVPAPEVQTDLFGDRGEFIARADLYFPIRRLVVEFDGSTHKTSLVEDNRRQNRLIGAGYRILRFTSADLMGSPDSVVNQVRRSLA